jgi:hypothetical protein
MAGQTLISGLKVIQTRTYSLLMRRQKRLAGINLPSTEFHVSKAGSTEVRVSGTANGSDATIGVYGTPSGGGSRDISLKYDSASDLYKLVTTTGNDITISNSAGEALRIDGSRRVGIGTTTVSAKLHIAGATGGG